MTHLDVQIAFNQGDESEVASAFPKQFSAAPVPSDSKVRQHMVLFTGVHPFLDYIAVALVFATGFGLKKFLESFATEAGKKLAEVLFKPLRKEERKKKTDQFADAIGVDRQKIEYDVAYKIVVCIEEEGRTEEITLSEHGSSVEGTFLECAESFRAEFLQELHGRIVERFGNDETPDAEPSAGGDAEDRAPQPLRRESNQCSL